MEYKSYILTALLLLVTKSFCGAQSLYLEGEVTVQPKNIFGARNMRMDPNGIACGVLFVHSTLPELEFKGDIVGDIKRDGGIYYLYLKNGANKIHITDGATGSVLDVKLPKIISKTVYEMTLYQTDDKGFLSLSSDPAGAEVTLLTKSEKVTLGNTPLKGNIHVKSGNYSIEINKKGYNPVIIGNIKIRKDKVTKLGIIKLKSKGVSHREP